MYRARDLRLSREVAIKVLASEGGDESRPTLKREAQALAAIDHPNIATVYGFEEVEELGLLVMELVPGETLALKLKRGPLPVADTLELARQLADALDAVHQRGVVHRDLKPANIQLLPTGDLKVLDFGLAKLRDSRVILSDASEESSSEESKPGQEDTRTDVATFSGRLAGTLPYLSPEQLRAEDVDPQTDAWSFGCCLFECLTGQTAFGGNTPSDTLANVLRGQPSWETLPPDVPDRLRLLLKRCLAKERSQRQRSLGDAGLEIEEITSALPSDSSESSTEDKQRLAPFSQLRLLAALIATALMAWAVGFLQGRSEPTPRRAPHLAQPIPTTSDGEEPFMTIRVPRDQFEQLIQENQLRTTEPREPSSLESEEPP